MQTGDVEKRFYPQNFENAKLTDIGKHLLLDWVIEKPGIYPADVLRTFHQLFCYLTYSHFMELNHAALLLWTMPCCRDGAVDKESRIICPLQSWS